MGNLKECLCHHCAHFESCQKARLKHYIYKENNTLTARENQILDYLVVNRGIILTYAQIIDYVWGNDPINERCLSTYIWRLRKKVPDLIQGKTGLGYYVNKDLPESFIIKEE